jgi:hypothetical protein
MLKELAGFFYSALTAQPTKTHTENNDETGVDVASGEVIIGNTKDTETEGQMVVLGEYLVSNHSVR